MIFQKKLIESLFLNDEKVAIECYGKAITYRELRCNADKITSFLLKNEVKKETLIGIILDNRADIISSIIGIVNAGCVFIPLDRTMPAPRLKSIVDDLNITHIISTFDITETLPVKLNGIFSFCISDLLSIPALSINEKIQYPEWNANDSLYVYFTSGSTGTPKGIVGKNCSLLQFVEWEIGEFKIESDHRFSQFISPYFDAFLRDVFVPLLSGGTICVPPSEEDFFSPTKIISWLDSERVSFIHCVPSIFRTFNSVGLSGDNFKDLRYVLLSGEKIIPTELVNWYSVFNTRIQLVNLYGTTETTMIRSFYRISPEDTKQARIPIGSPISETEFLICQKDFKPCTTLIPGDLYIISDYSTKGYLNAPELTREKFIKINAGTSNEKIAFKTGDKARLLANGKIELIGRDDRQVKVRGIRVELDEIELSILECGLVKNVSVTVRSTNAENDSLIAFIIKKEQVNGRDTLLKDIDNYLRDRLPAYMIPSRIIEVDEFPLLSNGKINYKALLDSFNAEKKIITPATKTEEKILSIWKEILGDKSISTHDSFYQIGGNSLSIMNLIGKLNRSFNVKVSLSELFKRHTVIAQSELIGKLTQDSLIAMQKAPKSDYYVLSSSQRRLYFLYEFDKKSLAYNIPQVVVLEGTLDKQRVEVAFKGLIERHESLRTSFSLVKGEPMQRVLDHVGLDIEYFDVSTMNEAEIIVKKIIRPFDLSTAPLLRIGLIGTSLNKYVLVVDIHHIVSDGLSQGILTRDFMALYNHEQLPELRLQYKDFASWQQDDGQQRAISTQRDFWIKEFSGRPEKLSLPTDFARPAVKSNEGSLVHCSVPSEQTRGLKLVAEQEGTTMFMVMLAAYYVLLSKLSGQDDIVLCTPIAGRQHDGLENIVGVFVNTLPLRNRPIADASFKDFLSLVKLKTLACFDNQEYPYEELIDDLNIERDTSHNPLFDVMIAYENFENPELRIPGLSLKPMGIEHSVSKFDLTLFAVEFDDSISLRLEYSVQLFKRDTIEKFASQFNTIISTIVKDPTIQIGDIEIISDQERQLVVDDFNDTTSKFDDDRTITSIFEKTVRERGTDPSIVFKGKVISYEELNQKSNQIARAVLRSGVIKGKDAIGIFITRSYEMIASILGVLKAGCAYLPIDPEYPLERINYIIEDSGLALMLSDSSLAETCKKLGPTIKLIEVNSPACSAEKKDNLDILFSSASLAYLIYTSGSTGKPKGVMVSHRNVINFIQGMTEKIELSPDNSIIALTTISFDIFVVETILPLLLGLKIVLADSVDQKNPTALSDLLKSQRVDYLQITPSHLRLLLHHGSDNTLEGIRILMIGGEPLPVELLNQVREKYRGRIYNMYGPTETTVWSTIADVTNTESITIGKPIANTFIRILDKNQNSLPIGVVGEIYIGGAGVSNGYWKNEKLTHEKFVLDPVKKNSLVYRTGDLGKWSLDGSIQYLGRMDNQVKVRGYRIELGEIEHHLGSHEQIQEAVVTVKEREGDKVLVAYYVAEKELKGIMLREYLIEKIPEYMIPSSYVHLSSLPLNANGKVDRNGLPDVEIVNSEGYQKPASEIEEKMLEIWADVLKIDKESISITASFFELGGHSLKAIVMVNKIFQVLNVEVDLITVFKYNTILALSNFIQSSKKSNYSSIQPVAKKEYYPISDAQRAMYLLQEFDRKSMDYNMTRVIKISGSLDKDRLAYAFHKIVERHEIFRTSFDFVNHELVQRISDKSDFEITNVKASEEDVRTIMERLIRPFDLRHGSLLRAALVEINPTSYYLMIDTHHIIVDGISHAILLKELGSFYNNEELPELKLQYKDYAEWQQSPGHQKELEKQKGFWLNEFSEEVQMLELPGDFSESIPADYRGGYTDFEIDTEDTEKLKSIAEKEGASLFMIILAIYNILLAKLSNQEDIVVGTLVAGREHVDVETMLGMFVVDLPMRNYPKGNLGFYEFLGAVKQKTLVCFENQSYQYKVRAHELDIQRGEGRNTLYDAFFIFPNFERENQAALSGLSFEIPFSSGTEELRYDISLIAIEENNKINLRLCCNKFFKKETRERFVSYFTQVVKSVIANPSVGISSVEIYTNTERELINSFNNTQKDIDVHKTFTELFDEQVQKTPDTIAAEHNDIKITYQELYDKSARLSSYLSAKKVAGSARVALCIPRGIDFLVSILGTFHSGYSYVPIDVDYPMERIKNILEDSEAEIVLSTHELVDDIEHLKGEIPTLKEVVCLDMLDLENYAITENHCSGNTNNLAYVIYTSGTTGKPKGVMIHQLGMINHLYAKINDLKLTQKDVIAQTASSCFDISVWQFLASLLVGGKTFIIDTEIILEPVRLIATLQSGKVTVFESVPSLMTVFLDGLPMGMERSLPHLKWMIPTGERLSVSLVKKWHSFFPSSTVLNAYGPTEASDDVTHYIVNALHEGQTTIPIGRPIQNTHIYIIDKYLKLCSVGVKGEICVAGLGVGKGYWNDDKRTRKSFIKNPFVSGSSIEYSTLFKTGDVGYYTGTGDVICMGRIDDQVKIRGFRIEPAEIENVLLQNPEVKEAIVLTNNSEKGNRKLAAFVILAHQEQSEHIMELKKFLKGRLPDYMVPSDIIKLERMPVTSNGKIDKRALLHKLSILDHVKEKYTAPKTDVEVALVQIWEELLGIEQIGINDDFFELGGHSLSAMRLIATIKNKMDIEIPIRTLFQLSTIMLIAQWIEVNRLQPAELSEDIEEIRI